MKVLVVKPDGDRKIVEVPDKGTEQLRKLQELVGGYLETIKTTRLSMKNNVMLVDEDGRFKRSRPNLAAERLAGYPVPLVGTAVVLGIQPSRNEGMEWTDYHE